MKKAMTVCVTGAAGMIAYSFIPQLCRGECFPNTMIRLRLLDITPALKVLKGVILELEDCNYPLLESVSSSDKAEEMFAGADVIVFLGGFPRKPGMERKDLLEINKKIFMEQAQALSVASPDVRCLVVANPANTNTFILSHFAKHVNPRNITCLSRLDQNRAISQISSKTGVKGSAIEGVFILGNHSLTQYPCIKHIKVNGEPIANKVDNEWLTKTYISKIQKRGGEILQVRGGTSVFSAANAVLDHLRDWYLGSDVITSMGVISEGDYGVPKGLWSSFPVRCKNFEYQIVKDYELSAFCKEKVAITVKELEEEISGAGITRAKL